jgi:hypothetical protein
MTGRLADALRSLLTAALPGLLGGPAPPVAISFVSEILTLDPGSADAEAGEPRIDDQTDSLPFNPAAPSGPYNLSKPPSPGPRRVRLVTSLGDRIALTGGEVNWDQTDPQKFSLRLRPSRDIGGVSGVEALYGVTAVFVKLKTHQAFGIQLQSANASLLEQAEALALGVLSLSRKTIVAQAGTSFQDGDYTALIAINGLKLVRGTSPAPDTRLLEFTAEVELKATRALAADEGKPILRIASPGRPADPKHPVDIEIGVDA